MLSEAFQRTHEEGQLKKFEGHFKNILMSSQKVQIVQYFTVY